MMGRKDQAVYLALETALGGNLEDCEPPTMTVREDAGSWSSSGSGSSSSGAGCIGFGEVCMKFGSRSRELTFFARWRYDSMLGRGPRRIPFSFSNGASSS